MVNFTKIESATEPQPLTLYTTDATWYKQLKTMESNHVLLEGDVRSFECVLSLLTANSFITQINEHVVVKKVKGLQPICH